jgi:hypothetical protein
MSCRTCCFMLDLRWHESLESEIRSNKSCAFVTMPQRRPHPNRHRCVALGSCARMVISSCCTCVRAVYNAIIPANMRHVVVSTDSAKKRGILDGIKLRQATCLERDCTRAWPHSLDYPRGLVVGMSRQHRRNSRVSGVIISKSDTLFVCRHQL